MYIWWLRLSVEYKRNSKVKNIWHYDFLNFRGNNVSKKNTPYQQGTPCASCPTSCNNGLCSKFEVILPAVIIKSWYVLFFLWVKNSPKVTNLNTGIDAKCRNIPQQDVFKETFLHFHNLHMFCNEKDITSSNIMKHLPSMAFVTIKSSLILITQGSGNFSSKYHYTKGGFLKKWK